MTDNVLAFPTMFDRDETEFRRKRSSSYTRVVNEASDLFDAAGDPFALNVSERRIDEFERAIERLVHHRPEVAADLINLKNDWRIELALMPLVLREIWRGQRQVARNG